MSAHMLKAEPPPAMRLRGEFAAMPGLLLTVPQVARLLGIRVNDSSALLTRLESDGFLTRTPAGAYRLAAPRLA